jgi:hypothetical protein
MFKVLSAVAMRTQRPTFRKNTYHLHRSVNQTVSLERIAFSGMLRRVALVRSDVSEELSASIIRVIRISKLGTSAVTSNRLFFLCWCLPLRNVPPKRPAVSELRGVTTRRSTLFCLYRPVCLTLSGAARADYGLMLRLLSSRYVARPIEYYSNTIGQSDYHWQ